MKQKNFKKVAAAVAMCMVVPVMCMAVEGCKKGDDPDTDIVQTATVNSITLDTSACKTTFDFKEDFSVAGLKVTAQMSDGTTQDVALTDCQISAPDTSMPGTRVVRVTYKGKQASYQITVSERVMPPVSDTPLFSIDIENPHTSFKVEMEDVDYEISGVQKANNELSLIGESEDESVSGGKYLANYGVEGNYFGFAFDSNEEYEDVTIRFHVANANTVVTGIGTNMNVYLNYNGYYDPNELDVSDLTVLPAATVVEQEQPETDGEEGEEVETPDEPEEEAPVEVTYGWETRVVRGVTIPKGLNKLTFEVTGENVVYIDYIEFYVGVEYYTDNYTELNGIGMHVKEFEDFDLEKIIVRQDIKNHWGLADGQAFVETPSNNLANTSGGKSVGATMPGTEISTVLHVDEDATVKVIFTAASVGSCYIGNEIEMYIDGVKLQDVEIKNIQSGNAGASEYWNWVDNSFGYVDLEAGDHVMKILVVSGGTANFDCVKFNVISWGEFVEAPVDSHFVIDGHGTYVAEAESMSFKDCTLRSDVTEIKIVNTWAESSGGYRIWGFGADSKFNVYFETEEDTVADLVLRLGYDGSATDTLAENCKFYLDGELLTLSQAAQDCLLKDLGNTLTDVTVAEGLEISAGKQHVLTIEIVNHDFGFDCVKLATTLYNGLEEPTVFVKEAETLDKSEVVTRSDFEPSLGKNNYAVGANSAASGGQKIHGFGAGTKFNVDFKVEEDCSVDVILALYSDQTPTIGENFKFYLDGEEITISNPDETMTPNSLHDVTPIENLSLEAGYHVFTIEVVAAHFDFDCIKFVSRTTIDQNNIQFDVTAPEAE